MLLKSSPDRRPRSNASTSKVMLPSASLDQVRCHGRSVLGDERRPGFVELSNERCTIFGYRRRARESTQGFAGSALREARVPPPTTFG